jgi:drug/metabolite transporter (DMT)-like permease
LSSKNKIDQTAIVGLIALSAIWGYNWVVMKECLRYSGALDFAALRTSMGAVGLFALLLWKRKPLRPKEIRWTILLGLLSTTGCIGFVTVALVAGGVGKTAILVYTMPFYALIMARPLLGEYIRGLQWVAVILAFAGLMTILEPWKLQNTTVSTLLALLSGISWAGSAIVMKIMRKKTDIDLVSLSAWQMLFGSIPLVILALTIPQRPIEWSLYFTGGVIYTSVIGQSFTLLLWFYILNKLSVGMASMGTLATPVIGVICASIQLGERPTVPEGAGMFLILSALALLSYNGIRQHYRFKDVIEQR